MESMKKGHCQLIVSGMSKRIGELERMAQELGVPVRNRSEVDLNQINPSHRGYILAVQRKYEDNVSLVDIISKTDSHMLILILDGINDPVNLGNILRSADQFGVSAVVIPRRRAVSKDADSLSRISAGAVEWMPVIEFPNCSRAIDILRKHNFWIWGANKKGKPSNKVDLTGRTAIVMGREGEGMHRLVREQCDGIISIPSAGRIDSFNVATATAILLYEAHRQTDFNKLLSLP